MNMTVSVRAKLRSRTFWTPLLIIRSLKTDLLMIRMTLRTHRSMKRKYTAGDWGPTHRITANYEELMITDDPDITRWIGLGSKWCVALKPDAAKLAGLICPEGLSGDAAISAWSPMFRQPGNLPIDREPRPGDVINLQAIYDFRSPRWPPQGVAGPFPGPTESLSKVNLIDRLHGNAGMGTS